MKEASIRDLVAWGCTVIMAWALLYQGLKKVIPGQAEEYQSKFIEWGYEPDFALPIATFEILAGIMVLIPRVSSIGALIAIVVMTGAAYTHWSTGIGSPFFALVILIVGVVLLILRWPDSFVYKLFARKPTA